jgi:hypothetical protein
MLPGIDQIMVELIQQEVNHYFLRSLCLQIVFGIRINFLSNGKFVTVPIYKKDDKTDYSNYESISLLSP